MFPRIVSHNCDKYEAVNVLLVFKGNKKLACISYQVINSDLNQTEWKNVLQQIIIQKCEQVFSLITNEMTEWQ